MPLAGKLLPVFLSMELLLFSVRLRIFVRRLLFGNLNFLSLGLRLGGKMKRVKTKTATAPTSTSTSFVETKEGEKSKNKKTNLSN